MKIALACMPVENRNMDFNEREIHKAMAAVSGKADLIVFGEAVLQGFDCLCWDYETDRHIGVALTDAPIQRIRQSAITYKIAVSFGFIQRDGERLYSSQVFIEADGEILHVFRRLSKGWKEFKRTDHHYQEGTCFERFPYRGITFTIGLCGDLWAESLPEQINALRGDVVLWPVWCDYTPEDWNHRLKYAYARQAALCGENVCLVNPFCRDPDSAAGGAAYFQGGQIMEELPAGQTGILIVDVSK